MPTLLNYQSYRLKAYAVVTLHGVDLELDITSFNLTFAVNSIPFGSLQLVVGRDIVYGQAATIHHIVDELQVTLPARVYLQVEQGPNSYGFPFESWPDGYFLVFEGFINSTGFGRTARDSVSFRLGLTHWLGDAGSSSLLTRSSHALTPQQLSGLAAFNTGTGLTAPGFFASTSAADLFTPLNVGFDFWGLALGPWLADLCQQDILSDEDDDNLEHNLEGLDALRRFEPFAYASPGEPLGHYVYGTPLALALQELAGSEELATAIAEDVASKGSENFDSTTLWDAIAGKFAADYQFKVIPLVQTALAVPAIAGQRVPWQVIYGEEYGQIELQANLTRAVKGVRLFTGMGSMMGIVRPGEAGHEAVLGGRYDNPDHPSGMLIYANAPRWSANVVAPAVFGADAVAPGGVRGGALFPGIGLPPAANNPVDLVNAARGLWDAFARALYVENALRGRGGSVQGKLRFDIAPGSTVEVRCVQDKFVQAQLAEPTGAVLYAEVQGVGICCDSETMTASTTFQLANVRTFAQNGRDALSIERHPLYANLWHGAPLAEHPEFEPQPNPVFP